MIISKTLTGSMIEAAALATKHDVCSDLGKRSFMTQEELIQALRDLPTDEARLNVLVEFCDACGSTDPTCQCWNDE